MRNLRRLIREELLKEQSGSGGNINQHGQTVSGRYTAVVDSGGQKVNIKCPQGQQVRYVTGVTNPSPTNTTSIFNPPTPGQTLGITGTGVQIGCYPITPGRGGMDQTPEIR